MMGRELISGGHSYNFVLNVTFCIFHYSSNNHVAFRILESRKVNFGSSLAVLTQRNNNLSTLCLNFEHIRIFHREFFPDRQDISIILILTNFKKNEICRNVFPKHEKCTIVKLARLITDNCLVFRLNRFPKLHIVVGCSSNPLKCTHGIS